MQIARATRAAVGRALSFAVVGLLTVVAALAALVPSSPSGAATSPTDTPTSPQPTKTLSVHLKLLGIGVGLDVPLSLNGLLNRASSTPSEPSTSPAPPSSSPPAPPTSPAPSTNPHPTKTRSSSTAATSVPPPPAGDGGGAPNVTSASRTPTKHPTTHSVQPSTSHASSSSQGAVFARRILPGNSTALLVSLLAVTILGVGLVVRMSGRRGGQHR